MKKFTTFLLFAGFLFFSFNVHAQNFALGFRGGISIPNLTSGGSNQNPLNTGYSSRVGADVSIFAEFKFSKLFSFQPMVEYSSQGGKKDGLQAFPFPAQDAPAFPPGAAPTYLYANFKSEAKLNYLMIPLLAKFGWDFKNSPFRFYADAGPFVSFLLSAHQVTSGQSQVYLDSGGQQALPGGPQSFDNDTNIKSDTHTVNLGAEANVGFNYKIGPSNIFIEGGFNYGFLNIQRGTANGKNNTGAGTVALGYSYWLGK